MSSVKVHTLPKGWSILGLDKIAKMYQPKTISKKNLREDGKYLVYGANGIIGSMMNIIILKKKF